MSRGARGTEPVRERTREARPRAAGLPPEDAEDAAELHSKNSCVSPEQKSEKGLNLMNYSHADWAFRQRFGGTPIQRILLVSLAMHADRNGECRITVRRLTEDANCCERAARSALKVLVDKGLITRRPTFDGDGARRADIYTVVGLTQRTDVVR